MQTPRRSRLLAFSLAHFLAALVPALALDLYVAPDGNDTWSGRLARPNAARTDGPLASLTGARDAMRALKVGGPLAGPVRVIIAGGRYELSGPLELGPGDSGTETAPVSFEAAPGARPVFSGGRIISGFEPGPNGVWQARVPEVAAGRWYFEQLFVNGRRATRARTPNKFWFHILDLNEDTTGAAAGQRAARGRQTIWLRPEDFQAVAGLTPEELKDVNLVVYHNWDNTRRFIERIDAQEKCLVTSGEAMKPWNPWRKGSTLIFENFARALDEPGEWFLARSGTLYYKPLPGEDMTKAEVVAPVVEKFLVIEGEPAGGRFVEHVTFKGLTFLHGQWLTPPGGFEPAQAAAPIEAVFQADGARHVTLEDCEIGHVGTYVVWFRKGCRDDVIRRCHLHDFGAGGVRIGETAIRANEAEQTSRVTVDNNIIRHGGSIFPCAVGVWIGHSGDNTITHNEIADMFYTGISAGWRGATGRAWPNATNRLQPRPPPRLGSAQRHGRHLHARARPRARSSATTSSTTSTPTPTAAGASTPTRAAPASSSKNNLVYDTKTGSFHQHYGKENIIRNNILVNSSEHQLQATRVETHLSFTFEKQHRLLDQRQSPAGRSVGQGADGDAQQLLLEHAGQGELRRPVACRLDGQGP